MVSFFINNDDLSKLVTYLNVNVVRYYIGGVQFSSRHDMLCRQVRAELSTSDLTALKLMFTIKHSMF